MDTIFVEEFQTFLNSLTDSDKKLIYWYCVMNTQCPESFYSWLITQTNTIDLEKLKKNYEGNKLLIFDENEARYLKDKISTLDGTLLADIIFRSIKQHQIFKTI